MAKLFNLSEDYYNITLLANEVSISSGFYTLKLNFNEL